MKIENHCLSRPVVLVFPSGFISTWHSLSHQRRMNLFEEMSQWDLAVRHFFQLVINSRGSIVDGAIPWLVVLGSMRKQAEQVRVSNSVGNTPSWPLHQLLPPESSPAWVSVLTSFNNGRPGGSVSQMKSFCLMLLWSWCFITAVEILTKTAVFSFQYLTHTHLCVCECGAFCMMLSHRRVSLLFTTVCTQLCL